MRSRWALPLMCAFMILAAGGRVPGATWPGTVDPASSYFPLQVGNQWVYQADASLCPPSLPCLPHTSTTVSVRERLVGGSGRTYVALENYFEGRRLVQVSPRGAVTEKDPAGRPDHLWYLLQAPVGTRWRISQAEPIDPCIDGTEIRVASRTDTVKVPAGEFRNVVRLQYGLGCMDGGIGAEWLAPGVGLIKRVGESIGGAWGMVLVAARVDDRFIAGPAYSTSLLLDRALYVHNFMPVLQGSVEPAGHGIAVMDATFLLGNASGTSIEFLFNGCKSATFTILDAGGNEILKARGDDGGCCECGGPPKSFTLLGNLLILRVMIPLELPDGTPLQDGRYVAVATLDAVNLPPTLLPSARAPLEVVLAE